MGSVSISTRSGQSNESVMVRFYLLFHCTEHNECILQSPRVALVTMSNAKLDDYKSFVSEC